MKGVILLCLVLFFKLGICQIYADTSSLDKYDSKGQKTGWWLQYADSTLTQTTKEYSVLKYYVFYLKGVPQLMPAYFIKDSTKFTSKKRKLTKFTDVETIKANYNSEFADGEYEFIRYNRSDSTNFWRIQSVFEQGNLVKQWVNSMPIKKGKIHESLTDCSLKYKNNPMSYYYKKSIARTKKKDDIYEYWIFYRKEKFRSRIKTEYNSPKG